MSRRQRTLVMGILNVTPDSFSDGGQHGDIPGAVGRARQMIADGADIIDIGGESTRPGAEAVDPAEEQQRIIPVLEQLLNLSTRISVDTRHPTTAQSALELAGDRAEQMIINDVSGLLTEPDMCTVAAEHGCEVVVMHNRGDSKTMDDRTDYEDVVGEVITELLEVRQRYLDAGVALERIILDPGIGFAKTHQQNWELVRSLERFTALEGDGKRHRVLFGASRKGFLGRLLADAEGTSRPADQRDIATAALTFHAAQAGCWAVRVHNPRSTSDALAVAEKLGDARNR